EPEFETPEELEFLEDSEIQQALFPLILEKLGEDDDQDPSMTPEQQEEEERIGLKRLKERYVRTQDSPPSPAVKKGMSDSDNRGQESMTGSYYGTEIVGMEVLIEVLKEVGPVRSDQLRSIMHHRAGWSRMGDGVHRALRVLEKAGQVERRPD